MISTKSKAEQLNASHLLLSFAPLAHKDSKLLKVKKYMPDLSDLGND